MRERRGELEREILARVHAIADPTDVEDPAYAVGLRRAVAAALEYAIAAIDSREREPTPVPDACLAQARAAVRGGIGLDTVLRRYSAGHALLGNVMIEEAYRLAPRDEEQARCAIRAQAALYDHLLTVVSAEYERERERRWRAERDRRVACVGLLLAGEPVDRKEFGGYELDAWHLAAIASGADASRALRRAATALDSSLLLIRGEEAAMWGWFGGRARPSSRDALGVIRRGLPADVWVGLGEPGWGAAGWRLSHRQAKAAIVVARNGADAQVRYAEVALLASALRDEVLLQSLHDLYLAPLAAERDDGAVLCRTLRAYFTAERNTSSAAAALGVSRKTVSTRLRTVSEVLGRPIDACASELDTALKLRDLANHVTPPY